MAGVWITGPLPTLPSSVPANWGEEIRRMTVRYRAAGPDPAWQQDDESDTGEPPEGADLDAIYDTLEQALDALDHDRGEARVLLHSAIRRLDRALP